MATRVLAFLLIAGGVVGIGIALWMGYTFIAQHWTYGVIVAVFLAVFAWSAVVGVRLWREDPRGLRWATILYGLQIPVLLIPGCRYEYFTGLSLKVLGGQVESPVSFTFGARAEFYLGPQITGLSFGVNLVALVAFGYLLRMRSNIAGKVR